MRVLLTGGTCLLGKQIAKILTDKGVEVRNLSRAENLDAPIPTYKWDIKNRYIDPKAFEGVDTIIHLAGAGVAEKRWSKAWKQEIIDSRVKSTELLYFYLKNNKHQVSSIISASAVGYYGDGGDELKTEKDLPGFDFLSTTCRQWEHSVSKLSELGLRIAMVRIGFVLSNQGGGLPKLTLPIRLFVGAPLGSGNQIVPWIHLEDIAGIFIHLFENKNLSGIYNGVAPIPVSNRILTKTIANILDKPLFLPNVPSILLKLIMGEQSSIVLYSANVSSSKIEESGYIFKFKAVNEALENLI